MATLYITRGVSGCGKSTWARSRQGAVVVSRDDLRAALFGSDGPDYYSVHKDVLRKREDFITKAEHAAIKNALLAGIDVVSDNTHIQTKYMKPIIRLAQGIGAKVEVKEFDVPLKTAIARMEDRAVRGGRKVPVDVIQKQHQQLQGTLGFTVEPAPVVQPYNGTPNAPKAFLVDIDGTLAHMRDLRGPFDWKNVGVDEVDKTIADIVNRLEDADTVVIVMSGRDEVCRPETEAWLNKHNIWFDQLFMRPQGDYRPDNIIKHELFNNHVRDEYDVMFVLDDRQQVVDMWRQMGITCLQVAPGDF